MYRIDEVHCYKQDKKKLAYLALPNKKRLYNLILKIRWTKIALSPGSLPKFIQNDCFVTSIVSPVEYNEQQVIMVHSFYAFIYMPMGKWPKCTSYFDWTHAAILWLQTNI